MKDLCIVATDAVSLNVLYRGQLEYLYSSGLNMTLVAGGKPHELDLLRSRGVGEVISVGLVRSPKLLLDLKALAELAMLFLRRKHRTVVLTTPKAILLGSIAAWATRQPRRVVFFRGRVYENYRGAKRVFFRWLDWIAAACSHEVLFVSASLMDAYCRDAHLFRRKGKVLARGSGNGVCGATFNPALFPVSDVDDLRRELGVQAGEFVVVSVGRLCLDKGLAEIYELAARAKRERVHLRFLLVGDVEEGAEVIFEKVIKLDNVTHVPFASDIRIYFAAASAHLFLSHREGFGNVALEAAAMGLPTIAFDVVGVRDSVANGVSGVRVPFGDLDAVWREIMAIKNGASQATGRFPDARQWALADYSQPEVWATYRKFYAR